MKVLKVPEMHCEKCVARIREALEKDGLKFTVNLEEQTVTIDGCNHCVATAVEILDDLGFSVEE